MARSAAASVSMSPLAPLAGLTTTVWGSGLCSNASSAAPKPDETREIFERFGAADQRDALDVRALADLAGELDRPLLVETPSPR
jgi:hypothetical protein